MKAKVILVLAALATICACQKENGGGEQDRTPVALEVSYSYEGEDVSSIVLSSASQTIEINVNINNEDLYWDVATDDDWLEIIPEKHRGSGVLKVRVKTNGSFKERDAATLVFHAGAFYGMPLKVSQEGNSFIIENPFRILGSSAANYTTEVRVPTGSNWDFAPDGWLTGTKSFNRSEGDADIYDVTVSAEANGGESRLGSLTLANAEGSSAEILAYQFGSEYTFKGDGTMVLSSGEAGKITFTAPVGVISSVSGPDFAKCKDSISDDTQTFVITIDEFLSDYTDGREVALSFITATGSQTPVNMPAIWQEYTPAGAVCTPEGLIKFAKAVNAGESIAEWQNDAGVVTLLNNIDMSKYSMVSIGTEDHPFKAVFDAKYHKIKNIVSEKPIFSFCKGATISGLTVGEPELSSGDNSKFEYDVTSVAYCSAIVGQAVDTKIIDCMNCATVSVNLRSNNPAYIGGVAASMTGDSQIINSSSKGKISIDATGLAYGVSEFAAGTVAGYVEGISASQLTSEGSINLGLSTAVTFKPMLAGIGGIIGFVSGDCSFEKCINKAVITMPATCAKSNSCSVSVGGIVGTVMYGSATFTSCSNEGDLENEQYNNDTWDRDDSKGLASVAGILGSFEPCCAEQPKTMTLATKLTITNCTNSGKMTSFRGAAAGILGFGRNVLIKDCTNTGGSDGYNTSVSKTQMHSYAAGIAGVLENAEVSGCIATMDVVGSEAGSENLSLGGIASAIYGKSSIFNCRYFGNISIMSGSSHDASKPNDCSGLIAAYVADGSTIDNCWAGGYIQRWVSSDSKTVSTTKVNDENAESLAKGTGNGEVSKIVYWDGK